MVITRRSLPRRTFLHGLSAAVALPFLESMAPAMTPVAQSSARSPLRFGGVYFPNGCVMDNWTPKTTDGSLEMTPVLKPLEPFRDQLTVVGNLTRAGGKNSTDHAVSSAGWLTGALAKQTEAEDIRVGISIDQVLAKHIGQETPFPSLEFATEDFSGYVGGCVPGYSCAYMNTISWASENAGLPMEIDPRNAFERMFGRAGSPADRQVRRSEDRSILDFDPAGSAFAEDESRRPGPCPRWTLSGQHPGDRTAYPEDRSPQRCRGHGPGRSAWNSGIVRRAHGTDVRSARGGLSVGSDPHLHIHDRAGSQPENVSGAGLQGDAPRHFASRPSGRKDGAAHPHQRVFCLAVRVVPREAPQFAGSRRLHTGLFVDRVRRRHERRAGAHSYPLPFSLVGGAGGRIKGNRFVVAPEWTPVANVWLGVAGMFGTPLDSIGESTGPLAL